MAQDNIKKEKKKNLYFHMISIVFIVY